MKLLPILEPARVSKTWLQRIARFTEFVMRRLPDRPSFRRFRPGDTNQLALPEE